MATLVFKTLRVGFPKASVTVRINTMRPDFAAAIAQCCKDTDCMCVDPDEPTIHHRWISSLIATMQEPFWLCDTDIIFFEPITEDFTGEALAGMRIPEWRDEFSGCITRARLHPSLLYIDPKLVYQKLEAFFRPVPETPFTPRASMIDPLVTAFKGQRYFSDTCSQLYHAIGGKAFSDTTKNRFFHFNFGTIPDLILPRLANPMQILQRREAILANPILGRGEWRNHELWYASRPV